MAPETKYLTLGIDREVFAVPVEFVQEILDIQDIARLPYAPPYLAGMIDVRGHGMPVIDLRVKLGLPAIAATTSTRIVGLCLEIEGRQLILGLIADRVIEVTQLDGELQPPPEIGARWRADYIIGIGRRGPGFVIVFNLPRLFSSDDIPFLAPSADAAAE